MTDETRDRIILAMARWLVAGGTAEGARADVAALLRRALAEIDRPTRGVL